MLIGDDLEFGAALRQREHLFDEVSRLTGSIRFSREAAGTDDEVLGPGGGVAFTF